MPLHVWYDSRLEGQSFLLNASAYGGREKLKSVSRSDFFLSKPWLDFFVHPPKNYCSTRAALQMICLGLCDLPNTHSCWCDASQIRKSPQKNRRWWKPSAFAQLAGRVEGKGGRAAAAAAAASHSFSCSVFGASAGSPGFGSFPSLFLSSFLTLSYSLCCSSSRSLNPFFFFFFFPHPLFIPPHPALGLSQGLNLWLWSYRSIGMATHALLCFVSMLAWRLAPWLGSVFMHCTHVMMYVRLVQAKMVHSRPLFPVSLRFFSPPYDRTKRRHISRCHQRRI